MADSKRYQSLRELCASTTKTFQTFAGSRKPAVLEKKIAVGSVVERTHDFLKSYINYSFFSVKQYYDGLHGEIHVWYSSLLTKVEDLY